jgi:PAS domain S-box-containing protein
MKLSSDAQSPESLELRRFADSAPAILWTSDAQGACTFLSRGWHDYTGQTEAEGLGAGWTLAVHPDDRAAAARRFAEANGRRESFSIEYRLRRADGAYRWAVDAGHPRFGAQGEYLGFVGSVEDAHERKFAEDALQASEARYRTVLRLMPAGLYTIDAPSGRITYFNEHAARIWGRTPRIGDTEERFCGSHKLFRPDGSTMSRDDAPMAIAMREGRPFRNEEVVVERPDGSRITVLVNIDPLRDGAGRIVGAVNVFHDISERRRAEQALRESEERLRAIVEATPECVKVVAADGTLLQMNGSGLIMVCAPSADAVIGRSIYDMIAPEDRDRFRTFNERVCAGEAATLEFDIISLSGQRRHMDTHAVPLRQPDGSVAQLAITRDISAAHDAARALALSEARYRAMVESQSEMVCRFRPDGVILFVNGAYARSRGLSPEDMIGQSFWEFIPREDRDSVRAMLDGLTPQNPEARVENRFVTTEGARWTLWANRALTFDEAGRATEVQSTGVDITERRRFEEALRTEEEKFRLLADMLPQLAWMARGADGHIFWYNKQWYEYTGTTPASMEGWGWRSVHDPAVLPAVLARWKSSIASGQPFEMVFPLRGADGVFRPFLTRVNPVHNADGRVLYWFGTNTEVTEIKRVEDALREVDRRKDEFLAILSHELRNPLAPIKNSVTLLRMTADQPKALHRVLPVLERQVSHLVRLVDDLLDVARINRGDIVLQTRPVTLAEIVATAVETSRPLIEARGHRFDIDVSCETTTVVGDPVRLAQVVTNVLNNAAAYTPPGGQIDLAARDENGRAVIRVRDNGAGIPPDRAKSIFELFVRGDSAPSHPAGFGVGLALARRIMQMHGGAIEAYSEGAHRGSEFVIHLPLAPVTRSAHADAPPRNGASGHRILIVDDNIDAAESLGVLLRTIGAQVRVVYNGPAALAAFEEEEPSIALLDIGMPGMDGYQVARAIRARFPRSAAMLVALTGWGQHADRQRAAEAGFDHHLVKPAEMALLQQILGGAVRLDASD